jgi:hypothetical protein
MATAHHIIDQAIRRVNELNPDAPIRWTRDEMLLWLNDALFELNLIAADNQDTVTITADNTHNIYDLPTNVVAPLTVRTDHGYLQRQQAVDMDNETDWEDAAAVRQFIQTWAPIGLTKILIYPRPIANTSVYVEVLSFHDPMLDVELDMPVRPEYERAIEDFMVSRAMFKEVGAEFQQALVYYGRFAEAIQQLSGRNIIRSLPSWDVIESTLSRTSVREGALQVSDSAGN